MPDSTTYSTNINPGSPPLRWDNVLAAFEQVNANFEMLSAALGASGLTPINFSDLDSSVIPSINGVYVLGSLSNQWKSVYTSSYSTVPGNEYNGLWAGNAHVKGIGTTIELPANSTVNGELIIDPNKNWYQSIQVDGAESLVATQVNDSFNLLSGTGISLNVDSSAESLTITNTGIVTASAGSGISVTGTNPLTIANTGVLTLANTGSLGTRTSGLGIHVSSSAGNPVITNTGVLSLSAGVGITVSLDAVTGDVTVSNNAPAVNTFAQVEVDGDGFNRLVADSVSDILNINSGYGITLSKNTATDTLTISFDPSVDIKGSVFADDSSLLVDGVAGRIVGPVFANVTGNVTGNLVGNTTGFHTGDMKGSVFAEDSTQLIDGHSLTVYGNIEATTLRSSESLIRLGEDAARINQGTQGIAIGRLAGEQNQGIRGIAIGHQAGWISQGTRGLAIGAAAGADNQGDYAIAIGQDAANGYQGIDAIAIGQVSAGQYQGTEAIAIGRSAVGNNQGARAIAIGKLAAAGGQAAGSIVVNATGSQITASAAGLYIDPIRSTTSSARPVVYNTSTKELFYTSTLEFINSTISTTDSSGLTVDVQTTFMTDVTFENDVAVNNLFLVRGQRIILLDDFKALVAASSSFGDFQTRIAAL